jgi:hypothetical protein
MSDPSGLSNSGETYTDLLILSECLKNEQEKRHAGYLPIRNDVSSISHTVGVLEGYLYKGLGRLRCSKALASKVYPAAVGKPLVRKTSSSVVPKIFHLRISCAKQST